MFVYKKKILWELNSFHKLKISFIPSNWKAADHVTENDLLISANFIRRSSSVHLNGQTLELHPQACTVVLFIII